VGEAGIEPTTPSLEGSCSIQLSYSPARVCIDCIGEDGPSGLENRGLAQGKILAAQQCDDSVQSRSPVLFCGLGIVANGFYIETGCETLLWASEIDECRADDAVEHGIGLIQRRRVACQTVHDLLHLVVGGEERSFTPEDVDVATEACRGIVGSYVKVCAKIFELVGIERPCIALRGEDRRSRCVERTQSMHQWWMLFDFREVIEVIGVLAEIDESAISGGIGWVRPGNHKHGIV
jgi:hypothetical protein